MKRLIGLLIGMSCIMVLCNAQLLWKMEPTNGGKVSYVFGTHHFAPKSILDSIPGLETALESVDLLYGEVDMGQMNDIEVMMQLQQFMLAPKDSTISKVLSTAEYLKLDSVWSKYMGEMLPLKMMDMLKPAALMTQMEAAIATKELSSYNANDNIDIIMQQRAKLLNIPVRGLETIAQQMGVLMGNSLASQAQDLMEYIDSIGENIDKIAELTEAYMKQDYISLSHLIEESNKEDSESAETLIYQRNENWIPILLSQLPDKSLMIVVGAGHLPGERGILNLLSKANYKVTPIR